MKQGDTVPVHIAGQVVANATVKEIDTTTDPWIVTLVTPATITRMAMRTQLAPEVTAEALESSEHVLLTDEVVKPEPHIDPAAVQNPALPEPGTVAPVTEPVAEAATVQGPPPVQIEATEEVVTQATEEA